VDLSLYRFRQQTEISGETQELVLFDTGPDSSSLVRNVSAMQIPVEKITRVVTSHWHSDHTGGLLSFLRLRNQSGADNATATPCIIDVHPDLPIARGIAPGPTYDNVVCRLPADPSFDLIQEAGGAVEKHDEGHVVAGDSVYVSGEIPRVTEWETGLPGAMRWRDGKWTPETVSACIRPSG